MDMMFFSLLLLLFGLFRWKVLLLLPFFQGICESAYAFDEGVCYYIKAKGVISAIKRAPPANK